jgi:hypothetical protein
MSRIAHQLAIHEPYSMLAARARCETLLALTDDFNNLAKYYSRVSRQLIQAAININSKPCRGSCRRCLTRFAKHIQPWTNKEYLGRTQ